MPENLFLDIMKNQGYQRWSQIGSDWPQMEQIWDFLRSVASHNVLKLILKSSRFVPFGANLTLFEYQIWHPCISLFPTHLQLTLHISQLHHLSVLQTHPLLRMLLALRQVDVDHHWRHRQRDHQDDPLPELAQTHDVTTYTNWPGTKFKVTLLSVVCIQYTPTFGTLHHLVYHDTRSATALCVKQNLVACHSKHKHTWNVSSPGIQANLVSFNHQLHNHSE